MEATLNAVRRSLLGGSESRRLRRMGRLPAVVYGGETKPGNPRALSISVDPDELIQILRSESGVNTLIRLTVSEGEASRVLVREYQLDPVSQKLLHVDFYQVAMDKVITVSVPIVLRGEAKGVKQEGGQLEFVHREIELECLPEQIPENLEVDVTELMIGQNVRVKDLLSAEAMWKPLGELDTMIVHVVAPRAEEVTEAAPAEATIPAEGSTEPEVLKKGKGGTAEKVEEK